MLTVDTHFEDGFVCDICPDTFGDNQYANVMACSSRQVKEFVDWVQQQDFAADTTIVISGDHPTMDSDFCEDVDKDYERRVYTTYINAGAEKQTNKKRNYTTFDNFPTTLAAMGVEIEGDRLGLGTNLYSTQQTLTERFGIEKEEKELINNVFDFGDSVAKDIMLPRIDVSFASVDMSYDELVEIFLEEQYSRLPVYEESKDNVIGILNLKDLFFYRETHRNEAFDIYKVLREPFFTYEYQKTSTLMEEMRNNSISFAIVLDEYGSTAGLVTLEDLIEEIVGDIKDEFDESETDAIRCIGTDEFEIEGSTKLDDLNDVLGTEIESEDYDSIGGHMIELLDHLPKEGETVKEGNYLYSIKKMDKNRVEIVYLKIERHTSEAEPAEM